MNAINEIQSLDQMPVLASVKAAGGYRVNIVWKDGRRAGRGETIDLSPLIKSFKFYRPLRKNPTLFRTVHLIDDGEAIAWGKADEIDMAATSVERLAEESMMADEFRAFLARHNLTQGAAAAVLGRSRRQIAYYLAQEQIPRLVALACFGFEARRTAPLSTTTTQQWAITIVVDTPNDPTSIAFSTPGSASMWRFLPVARIPNGRHLT